MQIIVLFSTIAAGIYFLLFDRQSPIAITIAALAPLGWVALFMLRFFTERKKKKLEKQEQGRPTRKKFKDPNEFLEKNS
jgi:hypothetical protein